MKTRFGIRRLLFLVSLVPITVGAGYSVFLSMLALQLMSGTSGLAARLTWISRDYGMLTYGFVVGIIGRIPTVLCIGSLNFGLTMTRHRSFHLLAFIMTIGQAVADIDFQWQSRAFAQEMFENAPLPILKRFSSTTIVDSAAALLGGLLTFVPIWLGLRLRGCGAYRLEQQIPSRSSKIISFVVYLVLILLAIAGWTVARDPFE